MELPTGKISKSKIDPRLLIIAGFQKSGKTTALAELEDNLIIDLEGGTDYLNAMKVRVNNLQDFVDLVKLLREREVKYRYGTIDTATKMEDIAMELAAINYRKTPMGKRWEGAARDIINLEKGAGYGYLRNAVQDLINWISPFFSTLILVCHIKTSSILKDGEDLAMIDVDLTGKIKTMVASEADAIGIFYRKKNKSILSFKGDESFMAEARPDHLRGKDFVIIESDKDNNLTIDWSQIFIQEGV
jgi:hypothetical protein